MNGTCSGCGGALILVNGSPACPRLACDGHDPDTIFLAQTIDEPARELVETRIGRDGVVERRWSGQAAHERLDRQRRATVARVERLLARCATIERDREVARRARLDLLAKLVDEGLLDLDDLYEDDAG